MAFWLDVGEICLFEASHEFQIEGAAEPQQGLHSSNLKVEKPRILQSLRCSQLAFIQELVEITGNFVSFKILASGDFVRS